jgi:uncharacterized protein YihD (DUF1040 family)
VFLLCSASDAVHPEEQWYLIQESELRSIEEYRRISEAERLNWLSQVQSLSRRAGILETELVSLNSQLLNQRELNRELSLSFNKYEAGRLTQLSLKDGEITKLKEEILIEQLKTRKSASLNVILGGILVLIAVLAAVYVYVKIRTGGLKLLRLFG